MLLHFMIYVDRTASFLTAIDRPSLCVVGCYGRLLSGGSAYEPGLQMFRNIEYVLCYSIIGQLKEENLGICSGNSVKYQAIAYIISLLPYWWRAMQCLRRWIDERDASQIKNGVKYLSALIAAGMALTYNFNKTTPWRVIFIVVSSLTATYQLYWDLYIDWRLLRLDSQNRFLRDQLILKNKSIYFISMALNTILRFAWFQSVTQVEFFGYDRHVSDLFFAGLEVMRRCMWNFFRLENEHLNNVGKFRSTKDIPLPFTSD